MRQRRLDNEYNANGIIILQKSIEATLQCFQSAPKTDHGKVVGTWDQLALTNQFINCLKCEMWQN